MAPPSATVALPPVLQTTPDPVPFSLPEVEVFLLRATGFLIGAVIVLFVGWLLVQPAISKLVSRRNRDNPTLEEAISRYVRLVIVTVAVFVGFSSAGFTGLVGNSALVVAAGTLALGVAGQSVIGSLVSGLALVMDPQFNIGDHIEWEGGEGEIVSITLRVTRVRTRDGGLVTIPNTTLTDASINRPFESGTRRTTEYVEISFDDDVDSALRVLAGVTEDVAGIRPEPAPTIGVEELGDDAVVLRVQYWVDAPLENLLEVQSTFARTVKDRLAAAGIEVSPATQRDLEGHLRIENTA